MPVRAEESLVPLEKGDVTAGDRGIVGGNAHIAPSPLQTVKLSTSLFHNPSTFPNQNGLTVGANPIPPKPPLPEEVPVRAEESLVPLEKGDSPQCGEMSRSDKGDGSVRDVTAGDRGISQEQFFFFSLLKRKKKQKKESSRLPLFRTAMHHTKSNPP